MPKSPRRHGKALIGAATVALLAAAPAFAAPPRLSYPDFSPINPRTTTPITFHQYAYDEDPGQTLKFAWDFAGGSAFTLSDENKATHTFSTDGVHWITGRVQDSGGEFTDFRTGVATHPDNWAPQVHFSDQLHEFTSNEHHSKQRLYLSVSDDSPAEGITASWDLDNDGQFGDGEAVPTDPFEIYADFKQDGTHPVKVKVSDGQGETVTLSGNVRTHTANEAPYLEDYYLYRRMIVQSAPENERWIFFGFVDDYDESHELTYSVKLDGNEIAADGPGVTLPADIGLGIHTVEVTATDAGTGPGGTTGDALSSAKETFEVEVVTALPHQASPEIHVYSYLPYDEHQTAPTYRTLENLELYAPAETGDKVAWDLDNDGEFDDAYPRSTYFSVANKGTYKVRAQVNGAKTYEKTIVVDKGPDYAPVNNPTPNPDTNTGGGNQTPVATPEQVKAAMATFLSKETAEFLQLIGGANRKGIDRSKAVLALGKLGPDQLPNGGTAQFGVYDKAAPKGVTARAAAAKRKLLGATKVTLAKGQSKKVQVKLNKKGKALVKKKGKVKLTVDATLTDALTGAQVKQSKTYTFKVKKKKRARRK